jgi:hypothetical protein
MDRLTLKQTLEEDRLDEFAAQQEREPAGGITLAKGYDIALDCDS